MATHPQAREDGRARVVHVIPSGLVAAVVPVDPVVYPTAKKRPFPKVTEVHACDTGSVLAVHVTPPSVEVAADVELTATAPLGPPETATKVPLPYATDDHAAALGAVDAVQEMPLFTVYAAEVE